MTEHAVLNASSLLLTRCGTPIGSSMMLLKRIDYTEFKGTPQEWALEGLTLGHRNLLVGKNATGKSRTLNIIAGLAKVFLGDRVPTLLSGDYRVTFQDGDRTLLYTIDVIDCQVVKESVTIDGRVVLDRGDGGEGHILAEKINNGEMIEFQTPQDEAAVFVRRDAKQHSFLEPFHTWANALRHYYFGTALGKESYAVIVKRAGVVPDGRDPDKVVALYLRAKKDFPGLFQESLIRDMGKADYPITDVGTAPPISIKLNSVPFTEDPLALFVKEEGLQAVTDQHAMSQGMFRVLSILIMVNYMECKQIPACLVIDDIGEGLDFDRSCSLINLLREKAERNSFQLIVSTNDRFVMNRVPLEEWSVLQRRSNRVNVLNYDNSRNLFEDFRFTGLSNFSFLELDYPNAQPQELAANE